MDMEYSRPSEQFGLCENCEPVDDYEVAVK